MTTTLSEIENSADQFCVDTHSERIDRPIFTNRARLTKVNSMLFAGLRDSVAFEIGHSVSEVQAVFTQFTDRNVLHVWAVVPDHDRRVYRIIYAKEKQIIGQFDGVDFDFNVVPSHGRDPQVLMSDPGVELAFLRK
jgi:hypothetical protein